MRLWVVRHAIAISRDDPACPPDPRRALTEKGRRRMERAAAAFPDLDIAPDRIISSPYVRARETAEIVADALGFPESEIEESASLEPGEDPMVLLAELGRAPERDTLVCGHAPHVDLLVARVANSPREFTTMKKGGTAFLELPGGPAAPGVLHWYLPPRALRELGAR